MKGLLAFDHHWRTTFINTAEQPPCWTTSYYPSSEPTQTLGVHRTMVPR
jgi:hypothetical protein